MRATEFLTERAATRADVLAWVREDYRHRAAMDIEVEPGAVFLRVESLAARGALRMHDAVPTLPRAEHVSGKTGPRNYASDRHTRLATGLIGHAITVAARPGIVNVT